MIDWERLLSTTGLAATLLVGVLFGLYRLAKLAIPPIVAKVIVWIDCQIANIEQIRLSTEPIKHAHSSTADAIQALADSHSPEAGQRVRPHVEEIKRILFESQTCNAHPQATR